MLSLQIGLQAINRGAIRQGDPHQLWTTVDEKVKAISKHLYSPTCRSQPRRQKSHSFSPLRFLCWASLLSRMRAATTVTSRHLVWMQKLSGIGKQSNKRPALLKNESGPQPALRIRTLFCQEQTPKDIMNFQNPSPILGIALMKWVQVI